MRRIAVVTIALSCVSIGHAQTLYQCAGHDGNSYQQTPCAASVHLVRTLETLPEPPPSREQLEARDRKAAQDRAESAFLSHLAGTDMVSYVRSNRTRSRLTSGGHPDRCGRAKTIRAQRLADISLGRTVDLLRRLDADVAAACQNE